MSSPLIPTQVEIQSKLVFRSPEAKNSLDSSFDEHDETYVVSESGSSDDSLSSDSDSDLDLKNIHKNIDFGSDNKMALKDERVIRTVDGRRFDWTTFLMRNEIPRKVFHSMHGVVALCFYIAGVKQSQIVGPLWVMFIIAFCIDLIRLNSPEANRRILPYVKYIVRKSERHSWNGIVFYLAGVSLVLTFAPKDIAVVSTVLLSWADTAASTFGRAYGKYTPQLIHGKSLAGSLASAFVGSLVCYFFYGYIVPNWATVNSPGDLYWTPETSKMNIHVYALASGLIASVSELVDFAGVDDNFTIPFLSSICLTALVWLTHI